MRDGQTDPASLLVCGFGPFPAAPRNPATHVVERLRDRGWSPPSGPVAYAVIPTVWREAPQTVEQAIARTGCRGVLMIGVAVKASGFRVEMRAQNRTARTRLDSMGAAVGRDRISDTGPAVARTTAPVAAMLAALRSAAVSAEASSDAGSYLCNFTLYSVLTGRPARVDAASVGFLHVPQAHEFGGADAATTLADIERAVCASAEAFSRALQEHGALAVA